MSAAFSTLTTFDDIRHCNQVLSDGTTEEEFLRILLMLENFRQEAQRIQKELDVSLQNAADLEIKLSHARRLLELENKARHEADHRREQLEKKIIAVVESLEHEQNLKDELKAKLAFLNLLPRKRKTLNSLVEEKSGNDINSTDSFLTELTLTHSEDDFPDEHQSQNDQKIPKNSKPTIQRKRSRCGGENGANSTPKRSNKHNLDIPAQACYDPVCAEPTFQSKPLKLSVKQEQELKCGIIETSKLLPFKQTLEHQHNFATKTFINIDICMQCQNIIHFGSIGLRCSNCSIYCHIDCLNLLTIACVPQAGTFAAPSLERPQGYIADYVPTISPMIPAILLHCVNEIEERGLNEIGIYCVTGSEREVKALKERFLFGEISSTHLLNIDVHVLCNCIKDFLRSLREPLIPTSLWKVFSNAVKETNAVENIQSELFKAIEGLPQANRDTLAFLIMHFQRITVCPEVRMSIDNIARVFGPIIVDYSAPDPDKHVIFKEVFAQFSIMQQLIQIPADYWSQFVSLDEMAKDNGAELLSALNSKDTLCHIQN